MMKSPGGELDGFQEKKPIGLKGGAKGNPKHNKIGLKLINNRSEGTGNICFVNSVIQLFRMTGYATFLLTQLPALIESSPISSYKGCTALLNLYCEQTARERSAAFIRKCVAQHSGKPYLNNGTQQDAEEFLGSLVAMVTTELATCIAFSTVQSNHWGSEHIRRVFLDNPPTGSCKKCSQYPVSRVDEFLCLKLTIPISASTVSLTSLIANYFSESTESIRMKCSNCCPHEKNKVVCPQSGFCNRPAATHNQLMKAPHFLFLQLLRFGNGFNGPKVNTLVQFEAELILPNDDKYEVLGAINHRGTTLRAGHYVTYVKSETDQWLHFDDTHSQSSSLEEANNPDNYILLFKRKVIDLSESVCDSEIDVTETPVIVHEDSCKTNEWSVNIQDELVESSSALGQNNLIQDGIEISSALSQTNNNTTEKDVENPTKGIEKLPALCQNNKKNLKQTDKELDECIKYLESLINKTSQQKEELKKVRNKKKSRQYYQQKSENQKEERRKQNREQKKAAIDEESEEQREERRKQQREYEKAAMGEMSEQKKEERKKQDRTQTKAAKD